MVVWIGVQGGCGVFFQTCSRTHSGHLRRKNEKTKNDIQNCQKKNEETGAAYCIGRVFCHIT